MTVNADLELLQAYLDGALSGAEALAVEARLKAEPELARLLVRLAREEAVLSEWARAARATASEPAAPPGTPPAGWRRHSEPGTPPAGWRRHSEPGTPPAGWRRLHPPTRRLRWLALPAAAAVLLAATLAGLILSLPRGKQESPVALARLEEVQGEVYVLTPSGDSAPAVRGQELFSGQGVRTRGEDSAAVVRYPDRTRLELGADTLVNLLAEAAVKKVALSEGFLAADVVRQPQGRPMVLTTPHVEVTAEETRFSSASGADLTLIDPQEGRLRVTRRSDGRSVELASGSYLVASLRDDVPGMRPFAPQSLPARFKQPRAVLRDAAGPVQAVAVSPDGKTVATGGSDGGVWLWDVVPPAAAPSFLGVRWGGLQLGPPDARRFLAGGVKPVRALAFSPDGKSLAAVEERAVRVWDPATGEERAAPRGRVTAVTYLPDGTLVTAGPGGKGATEVRLWADGREQAALLSGQREPLLCVAASPDGARLAVGLPDGGVRILDVKTLKEVRTLQAHTREVRCLAFSPDGKLLATGGRDQVVWLWDTATWAARGVLSGHPGEVRVVAFAPDGRTLVSGGGGGVLKFFEVASGQELMSFRADRQAVGGLAFSPDGRTLVTSGGERTVKLWDTAEVR